MGLKNKFYEILGYMAWAHISGKLMFWRKWFKKKKETGYNKDERRTKKVIYKK